MEAAFKAAFICSGRDAPLSENQEGEPEMKQTTWLAYNDLAWTESIIMSPAEYAEDTEYFGKIINDNQAISIAYKHLKPGGVLLIVALVSEDVRKNNARLQRARKAGATKPVIHHRFFRPPFSLRCKLLLGTSLPFLLLASLR